MHSPPSFDRSPSPPAQTLLLRAVGFGVLLLGCRAAWFYHQAGLTLSHYDAKGHLVVARRVLDSLTPGWGQIGAVWLPLPHVLNLLPVQIDAFYRTGASAVAISVLAFALASCAIARIVVRATGSAAAAAAGAAVLALNPNLLYLQSTPMTEALLVGLTLLAVSLTIDWLDTAAEAHLPEDASNVRVSRRRAGFALAAACLTRYEAWFVTAALLAFGLLVLHWRSRNGRRAIAEMSRLALYPLTVALAFVVQSRATVGKWFVTDGFFVPDNIDTGNPFRAVGSVWWGTHVVAGHGVELLAVASAAACVVIAVRNRRRGSLLAPLALFAAGALPAYAFFDGHPFRIRYMTPLVAALGVYAGLGVGLLGSAASSVLGPRRRHLDALAAAILIAVVLVETPPFDRDAPMVLEAQWDSGNSAARRAITRYLAVEYDGRPIMASMGSLAHYMQELSRAGFVLRDFLHEGNGDLWYAALRDPRSHVGWVLMEEWSEGGDALATLARRNPRFMRGFERVAEGGGVALYRVVSARAGDQGRAAYRAGVTTPAGGGQGGQGKSSDLHGANATK